jgi:thiosulfate dehydrogenase [quinone] large subunit
VSAETGIDDQEDTMTTATRSTSRRSAGIRPTLQPEQIVLPSTTTIPEVPSDESPHRAYRVMLAVTRIALGWIFLWAFIDKLFGLGHETPSKGAWINGGSPTEGFLGHATKGPFADLYQNIAGSAWADWLFMAGLAGIGTALIVGVAMRFTAAAGAALLVMMWTAVLPPDNNPFMDDHLIYALVLIVLAMAGAHRTLGLGRVWERIPLVARNGWLK